MKNRLLYVKGDKMTLIRISNVKNGDTLTKICIYSCNRCSTEIHESFPHTEKGDKHYCWNCSYINGLINEVEYLSCSGIVLDNVNASIRNGEVIVWVGEKAPWERTNKDERNSVRYRGWRTKVFERDDYTCQHCHKRGGELNAHHIKPFAKYKDLRFELSNGLTLCIDCHREVHRNR